MEPYVEKFRKEIGGVTFSKPKKPIISSITGDVVHDEMCHADYWCTHICKTVRFYDAVKAAEKQEMGVFVEIGGTAALSGLAADCMADKDAVFLPSLRKGIHPWKQINSSLAQLYSRGIDIDWVHFHNPDGEKQLVSPSFLLGQDRKDINNNQENIMEIKQDKKTMETLRNSDDLTGIMERQLALIKQQYQATFEIMANQLAVLEEPSGLEHKPESQREDGEDHRLKERYRPNFRSIKLEPDDLTGEQQEFLKEFIGRYTAKTQKSRDYIQAHRRVMSDWLSMLNFRVSLKELAYPIVSQRSAGARIWDLDGNEYIDIAIGYGANYFGHKPGFVQEALAKQRTLAGEVARLISQLTGVERVVFSNTGTEAVMTAVRIARTVTGRDKIVRFAGSFHGTFDGILAEADEHGTYPISPGTPQGMVKDTIVLPYVSPESLEKIEDLGEELAAVLVEPVQSRKPDLEPRDFLQRLREITSRTGAAFIFDDIYIGFRLHQGGSRAYFNVEPDIVTFGKIIGGGLPIGIVAGKKEFLDAIDGGYWNFGDSSVPAAKTTFYGGTFLRHPLVLAASHAALKYMKEQGTQLQERVNQKGQYLADEVNAFFKAENVPVRLTNAGSSFRFESLGKYHQAMLPLEMELFYYLLTYKGIYLWERRTCSLSTVHTDEDIRFIIAAVKESIKELRQGGFTFSTNE
jgi:glutamate-1-semialdehyde aminotransferase